MTALFVMPFLGHFALVCLLYAWLTLVRQRAMRAGEAKLSDFVRADGDPISAKSIQRNLSNQFELPMFAYFAATLLIVWKGITWFDVGAAWMFFIGRCIHSGVQTLTSNVALRGTVFVINFVAVAALMAHVAWLVLAGAP